MAAIPKCSADCGPRKTKQPGNTIQTAVDYRTVDCVVVRERGKLNRYILKSSPKIDKLSD